MPVCLLTSDPRHSPRGERVAALAERLGDATVVVTGTAQYDGTIHVDELSGSFDTAVAFGWRACIHLLRADAAGYAYWIPTREDEQLWHGDEQRLLASLTYDLPVLLIAESQAVAASLRERNPDARVAVVPRGWERGGEPPAHPWIVELGGAADPLEAAVSGMLAGAVPVVHPVAGHDEYVEDGVSGIVVGFDDEPGAKRAVEMLSRDSSLLERLKQGASERAAGLPNLDAHASAFRAALANAPRVEGWPRRLMLNAVAVAEPVAQERRALEEVMRRQEAELTDRPDSKRGGLFSRG